VVVEQLLVSVSESLPPLRSRCSFFWPLLVFQTSLAELKGLVRGDPETSLAWLSRFHPTELRPVLSLSDAAPVIRLPVDCRVLTRTSEKLLYPSLGYALFFPILLGSLRFCCWCISPFFSYSRVLNGSPRYFCFIEVVASSVGREVLYTRILWIDPYVIFDPPAIYQLIFDAITHRSVAISVSCSFFVLAPPSSPPHPRLNPFWLFPFLVMTQIDPCLKSLTVPLMCSWPNPFMVFIPVILGVLFRFYGSQDFQFTSCAPCS